MIIASWNVNGLRAVATKGFPEWIKKTQPEIIALQEIKAQEKDAEPLLRLWSDDYETFLFPGIIKGYSGTALLIKKTFKDQIIAIHRGLEVEEYDNEGRLIWVECKDFILMNGYFPNGGRDLSRVDFKLDFSRKTLKLALKLHKTHKKPIIITGDINTAHTEIDLANPKSNVKSTGFLPRERVFIDEMIAEGFNDLFRHFHPGLPEQYTWWTYRGDCRERNIGWRLDYFFSTPELISKVQRIEHLSEVLGSDHCPILLELFV